MTHTTAILTELLPIVYSGFDTSGVIGLSYYRMILSRRTPDPCANDTQMTNIIDRKFQHIDGTETV